MHTDIENSREEHILVHSAILWGTCMPRSHKETSCEPPYTMIIFIAMTSVRDKDLDSPPSKPVVCLPMTGDFADGTNTMYCTTVICICYNTKLALYNLIRSVCGRVHCEAPHVPYLCAFFKARCNFRASFLIPCCPQLSVDIGKNR